MQLVSSMTNEQLVQQIAGGSETAFNELYHATYRMVYLQAQKLLHDRDAAETVTQDVFVTVYRNIGKLEDPEALRSWIGGIAVRLALKQRQKLAALQETDIESEQIMDILDDTAQEPTPESTLCEAENGRIIAELVDQLPEQQRAAVLLYYYDTCAIRQIAEIMQCSEGTVKSRLNYARKTMQQLIEQKERRDNIRLHSFSPGLLLLGLGAKEQALQLSQSTWQSVIAKLGLGAAAGAGAGSAAAGTAAKTAASAGAKAAAGAAGKAVSVKIAAGVTAGALLLGGTGVAISTHQKTQPQPQPTVSLEQRVGALSKSEQRELWRTAGYLQVLEDNKGWLQYACLLDMDADGTEELLVSGMLDEEDSRERQEAMLCGRIPVYAFLQTEPQTLTSHDFFPRAAYSSNFRRLPYAGTRTRIPIRSNILPLPIRSTATERWTAGRSFDTIWHTAWESRTITLECTFLKTESIFSRTPFLPQNTTSLPIHTGRILTGWSGWTTCTGTGGCLTRCRNRNGTMTSALIWSGWKTRSTRRRNRQCRRFWSAAHRSALPRRSFTSLRSRSR